MVSANSSLHHNFSIQLGSSTITPPRTARNFGVVIDDQLSFTDRIATTARSCRFALYKIRKIRPFMSAQATQLLVQVTPLFIRLHWPPVAARIKFKVLMFASKTTTGAAPIYINLLVQTYVPSKSLRSASERRLVVPSERGTKSLSRTFPWTESSCWNDLPISIRVFSHFQKTNKYTSLSPAPDQLILTLYLLYYIIFYSILFYCKMIKCKCLNMQNQYFWINMQ